MREQCGTPAYIAPEILKDKGYYGFKADVWSAGGKIIVNIFIVVLFAMLYGTVPFKASNMSELHKMIMQANYVLKDDISEEARSLIRGMLEADPRKRMTVRQIL
jgi:5'-AMP-activated protein kinase catalytic alpha subunit